MKLLLAILAAPCVLAATQYKFSVNMEGKKGEFVVEVEDSWAPLGAARFHELAAEPGFFDGVRFFRTVAGFMTQFGIPGKPSVAAAWKDKKIADDPVKESNLRGHITFATSGKDSRTTQMFINLVDNKNLDGMCVSTAPPSPSLPHTLTHTRPPPWKTNLPPPLNHCRGFAPFGKVVSGMEVVDSLYSGYGEGGSGDGKDGRGPSQGRLQEEGNKYLKKVFPALSYIESVQKVPAGEL